MSLPTTQRAWFVVRSGKPSQALEIRNDYPIPRAKVGEVLVKVQAAALNPVGYKLMGILPNFLFRWPLIAEHDLTGVVVDANGSEFQNGDEVFGINEVATQIKTKQGALAQYVRVPASTIVHRPSNVTATQAAGLALAGQTAYQGLFEKGKLEAGQTVFINGGSSAVGAFAIQMAKAKGCKVIASASGKNEDYVKELGADEFVDYTQRPLHIFLSSNPPSTKYHLLFDTVGLLDPSLYTYSASYLAPTGVYVSTGPLPELSAQGVAHLAKLIVAANLPTWLGGMNRAYKIISLATKKADLEYLRDLVGNGQMKPLVDSVYEFDDALKAYDKLMTHRAKGKVVIRVDPDVE